MRNYTHLSDDERTFSPIIMIMGYLSVGLVGWLDAQQAPLAGNYLVIPIKLDIALKQL